MTNVRIDAKGKIFTDVIRKDRIPVLIQTLTNVVHGFIFLRFDERVKDSLNDGKERFIAVSDAEVYSPAGQLMHKADFLSVNKDHVVWVRPDDDRPANEDQPSD